jgi:hypothetical protein
MFLTLILFLEACVKSFDFVLGEILSLPQRQGWISQGEESVKFCLSPWGRGLFAVYCETLK